LTDYPLTFKCNDNCISCILDTEITSRIPDPSLKQIADVIDKIDSNTDYFGVGGGEPTLRKELFKVLKYTRERHPNLYIFLVTNGRMFAYEEFVKNLADLKLGNYRVAVALYGHREEVQENITRSIGSFEQTVQGIKNLISFNIPTEVRTIINRINYRYLEELANFIVKEFQGLDRVVFVNMKITGNAYKNRDKVLVRYNELVPFVEKAVEVLRKNNIKVYLYHFPLCIIPGHLWDLAKGITKAELEELTFVEECEKCKVKQDCPMIWKTYATFVGKDEFKAVD
jgi:His-Xaa-Ser system radical SAM maturase HxsC